VDLTGRELVIGRDREAGDARRSAHAIRAGERLVDRLDRPLARLLRPISDLLAGPTRRVAGLGGHALELRHEILGLVAAARDQAGDEVLGVAAGHAPAANGVVDDLLQPVARDRDAPLQGLAKGLDAFLGTRGLIGARALLGTRGRHHRHYPTRPNFPITGL